MNEHTNENYIFLNISKLETENTNKIEDDIKQLCDDTSQELQVNVDGSTSTNVAVESETIQQSKKQVQQIIKTKNLVKKNNNTTSKISSAPKGTPFVSTNNPFEPTSNPFVSTSNPFELKGNSLVNNYVSSDNNKKEDHIKSVFKKILSENTLNTMLKNPNIENILNENTLKNIMNDLK